jgi:hypothetical protein
VLDDATTPWREFHRTLAVPAGVGNSAGPPRAVSRTRGLSIGSEQRVPNLANT